MRIKYILLLVALIICVVVLSSCGNRQVGFDSHQTFNVAYINLGGEWTKISIKSWRDFDNGDEIQVVDNKGKVYLTHYSNMVLANE